jgi:flagellar biosynthesis protein FliR
MVGFTEAGILYLARITPLFLMPNLLPIAKLPGMVKVVLSMCIALLLTIAIPASSQLPVLGSLESIMMIGQEFFIGIGLVFGIQISFAALLFAGKIIDLQLGFGVASVLDPMTQSHEALTSSVLNALFTVAFFILDMHHVLVKGIAATFHSFPVGSALIAPDQSHLISFFSSQFVLGLLVVMPTMLGLFMLDMVIAFASRTMPQVNVYFVSLPLKIFTGITILSISLKYMSGFIERFFTQSMTQWFSGFSVVHL